MKRILLYNSGGGIGDAIQILPLIETLRSELKNTEFYYLSAHENHFNTTLKDFNCKIDSLNLGIKYFGFRWWHTLVVNRKLKEQGISKFDLIIDLQSKLRNSIILKLLPHKFFISSTLNYRLSVPKIKIEKSRKKINQILKGINFLLNLNMQLKSFDFNKIDKKIIAESERLLPAKNYVGFSITQGNVYRKKEWPILSIIKTAKKIVEQNKTPVFLIEKKYSELKNKIQESVPTSLFPEFKTNLNSAALVTCLGKKLEYAISIDNGVMHMLSLSQTPMIVLFGPTESEKFAPEYKKIVVLDSKKINKSSDISTISCEDVLEAAKRHLNF
jgi:ADP-heptose:LPS heptosyltransferase